MRRNNKTNAIIKWSVIVTDFLLLGLVLAGFALWHGAMAAWSGEKMRMFITICTLALLVSESKFHSSIHERIVGAGDILKQTIEVTLAFVILSYLMLKVIDYRLPVGWLLLEVGTILFELMLIVRYMQRIGIKEFRKKGRNTRTITFVGDDPEMAEVYEQLVSDPSTGYRALGVYAEERPKYIRQVEWLGTLSGLLDNLDNPEQLHIGDELYVCIPKRERAVIQKLSGYCDHHTVRFFYVPISVESIRLDLKREFINDIEVYTTHDTPLKNPLNWIVKRLFDIIFSAVVIAITAIIYPVIYLVIKIQSPGPVLFRQQRTGLDGKSFEMLKFRSMHVNDGADTLQATENDPRKFAFGDFMRKTNIDELPQFWNVLRGDMSIVGPRPHMLAHTKMYSELIDKYMVRHFIKPGITGWAQVTGYRGETREVWQMEGRVQRDIWYMEHWTFWLDCRIIWLTIKSFFVRDKNAY